MKALLITKSGFTREIEVPSPPFPIWREVFYEPMRAFIASELALPLDTQDKEIIFYMDKPELGVQLTYREK